jgi:mono/diheme cytochrome c family protein
MRLLIVYCIALALGSSAVTAQPGRVQRGQTFAQTNCSQCHAIGRFGDSPIPETPPFRALCDRYPVEDLAEAFAEGITTGHPPCPDFSLILLRSPI